MITVSAFEHDAKMDADHHRNRHKDENIVCLKPGPYARDRDAGKKIAQGSQKSDHEHEENNMRR